MSKRIIKKYRRRLAAGIKDNPVLCTVGIVALALIINTMSQERQLRVAPDSYRPLLAVIAEAESKGNYNAYFGHAHNTEVDFTSMSVAEVMQWQKEQVAAGSPSSAVGRYQIINTTLAGLVAGMNLAPETLFNEATQDSMAIALLEQRGSLRYVNKQISSNDFAANLAMEWASLPKVVGDNPDSSYYAGDGLNKSLVSEESVLKAIDKLKPLE